MPGTETSTKYIQADKAVLSCPAVQREVWSDVENMILTA